MEAGEASHIARGKLAGAKDWSEKDVLSLLDAYRSVQTAAVQPPNANAFWQQVRTLAIAKGCTASRTDVAYKQKFKRLRRDFYAASGTYAHSHAAALAIGPFYQKLAAIMSKKSNGSELDRGSEEKEGGQDGDRRRRSDEVLTEPTRLGSHGPLRLSREPIEVESEVESESPDRRSMRGDEAGASGSRRTRRRRRDKSDADKNPEDEGDAGTERVAEGIEEIAESEGEGRAISGRKRKVRQPESRGESEADPMDWLKKMMRESMAAAEKQREWEKEEWRRQREVLEDMKKQNDQLMRLLCGALLDREDVISPILSELLSSQQQQQQSQQQQERQQPESSTQPKDRKASKNQR